MLSDHRRLEQTQKKMMTPRQILSLPTAIRGVARRIQTRSLRALDLLYRSCKKAMVYGRSIIATQQASPVLFEQMSVLMMDGEAQIRAGRLLQHRPYLLKTYPLRRQAPYLRKMLEGRRGLCVRGRRVGLPKRILCSHYGRFNIIYKPSLFPSSVDIAEIFLEVMGSHTEPEWDSFFG